MPFGLIAYLDFRLISSLETANDTDSICSHCLPDAIGVAPSIFAAVQIDVVEGISFFRGLAGEVTFFVRQVPLSDSAYPYVLRYALIHRCFAHGTKIVCVCVTGYPLHSLEGD